MRLHVSGPIQSFVLSSGKIERSNSIFSKARAAGIATRPGSSSFHSVRSMVMSRIAGILRPPSCAWSFTVTPRDDRYAETGDDLLDGRGAAYRAVWN
jgi:hypothetical protein